MYFDNNDHIDDYFKRGLKDYSQVPDDAMWKSIEQQLSEEKKVRKLFFFKVAAGLLVFIGLATFLAFEVSYFSLSEKNLASMNLNEELENSIKHQELEKYSRSEYNVLKDSQLNASDVSVPRNILSNQGVQSQMSAVETDVSSEGESLAKMTAMNVTLNATKRQPDFTELAPQTFISTNKVSTRKFSFQNNVLQNSRQRENQFSLSGSFSPIMSYRNTNMTTSNSAFSNEKSMLSFSGGMNVAYNIGSKLTLRTGLHYAKIGQSLNGVEVKTGSYAIDGENTVIKVTSSMGTGQINKNNIEQADITGESRKYVTHGNSSLPEFTIGPSLYQTFEMVKMPFILEYLLLDEKFNISMIGGLNANLLVDEGIYMEQAESSERVGSTKDLSKLSYSGTFGIGLKYDVSEKAQLFMEPSIDYYLTSLSSDNSHQTFPYFFGFFSGVSISF